MGSTRTSSWPCTKFLTRLVNDGCPTSEACILGNEAKRLAIFWRLPSGDVPEFFVRIMLELHPLQIFRFCSAGIFRAAPEFGYTSLLVEARPAEPAATTHARAAARRCRGKCRLRIRRLQRLPVGIARGGK